jgi:hypothetical protein
VRYIPSQRPNAALKPAGCNETVHFDLVGPFKTAGGDKTWMLGITDGFSRWIEGGLIEDSSAATVAKAIHEWWLTRWGAPRFLVSDRGANMCAEVVEQLATRWGVGKIRTTAYHPQSNGVEESWHRSFKTLIAKMLGQEEKSQGEWTHVVHSVLFLLRNTVNASTKQTPHRMFTGREAPVPESALKAPETASLVADGILKFGDARATKQQKAGDEATVELPQWSLLVGKMSKELRLFASSEAHQEQPGSSAEQPQPHNQRRQRPRPSFAEGDLVRVWMGKGLQLDPLVLNAKFSPYRWSALWRVHRAAPDSAWIDISLASDPLVTDRVAWMQVKKASTDAKTRAAVENLFKETMRQKAAVDNEARLVKKKSMEWNYEDHVGEEFEVEKILDTRVTAGERMVLVKFVNMPTTSWEPLVVVAMHAPQPWADFCKSLGNAKATRARQPSRK